MGLRLFRRVRLAPGFTLNLTKRGASLSVGRRGAHFTAGTSGTRETVGIPGTGLYYTQAQHRRRRVAKHGSIGLVIIAALAVFYLIGALQ